MTLAPPISKKKKRQNHNEYKICVTRPGECCGGLRCCSRGGPSEARLARARRFARRRRREKMQNPHAHGAESRPLPPDLWRASGREGERAGVNLKKKKNWGEKLKKKKNMQKSQKMGKNRNFKQKRLDLNYTKAKQKKNNTQNK